MPKVSDLRFNILKYRAGFTLVELLIAVSLIAGVFSTAVFVNTTGSIDKAKDAQRVRDIEQIKNAVDLYYHDNNCYPASTNTAFSDALTNGTSWQEGSEVYMKKMPKDPADIAYTYKTDTGTCPQWMIVYSDLSRTQTSFNSCKLPGYVTSVGSSCTPAGFDDSFGCVSSGNITCNLPSPTVTPTGIPTGTPTPSPTPSFGAPQVTTLVASSPTSVGFTLNATVNSNGQSTNYWWQYGTSSSGCSTLPQFTTTGNIANGTSTKSLALTGLSGSTTYYFCAVAQNGSGTVYGDVLSFTMCTNGYHDLDGDGYGAGTYGCYYGGGVVVSNTDCNDSNSAAFQTLSLTTDADQDGYYTGSASSQCVGNTTVVYPASSAISQRGTSTTCSSSGANCNINKPTGVVDGDLMVAFICSDSGGDTITAVPTGWTARGSAFGVASLPCYVYTKTAASEGASYTWTWVTGNTTGIISAFYTTIAGSQVTYDAGSTYTKSTTGDGIFDLPAITTTQNGSKLIAMYASDDASASCFSGYPSPLSEISEVARSSVSTAVATGTQAVAGSTGVKTATCSTNGDGSGMLASLKLTQGINYYSGPSGSPISQRGASTTCSTSSANCSISKPASVADGDLMVAFICSDTGSDTITTAPTGWTARGSAFGVASLPCYVYTKTASSEVGPYIWTWGTGTTTGIISAFYTTDGGVVSFDTGATSSDGSTGAHSLASITTSHNNELLIGMFGSDDSSAACYSGYSSPLSEISEVARSSVSTAMAIGAQAVAGSTGAITASCTDNGDGSGMLIGIYSNGGTGSYATNLVSQSSALGGSDCNDSNNTGWLNLTGYPDSDNDTYTLAASSQICTNGSLPTGYLSSASSSVDCYDLNANANTAQTAYFTADRGDGSYDYNCVNGSEKSYTGTYHNPGGTASGISSVATEDFDGSYCLSTSSQINTNCPALNTFPGGQACGVNTRTNCAPNDTGWGQATGWDNSACNVGSMGGCYYASGAQTCVNLTQACK